MADILSAPTTTTFLYCPVSINLEAVPRANRNPEQAAFISKLQAFLMPTLSQTIFEEAGNSMSGVTVAIISKSISSGEVFVFLSKPLTASAPISDDPRPSPFKICLSLIPVRVMIHSSVVSTIFSSSALVSI